MKKTWIISNDWQIPFHDEQIIDGLLLPFIKWLKPDGFIWNGDIVDCYELSEFSKNPLLRDVLFSETETAQDYMGRIGKMRSIQDRIWIGGNHEDRLRRYMWQHAGRLKLDPQTTFEQLFQVREHSFVYLPYGAVVQLGKLDVTHGSVVRQHSGWSAKAAFEKRGGSVLVGHTHRGGTYYRTNAKGTHGAFENFCMCRLDPEYVQDPDWQQGFSVVHVGRKGFYHVQSIPIINRSVMFYGREVFEL